EERPLHVHAVHLVEHVLRIRGDRADCPGIAGVAEDHIDLAPAIERGLEAALDLSGLGYVRGSDRDPLGWKTRVREARNRAPERLLLQIRQHDARAFLEEEFRAGEPDAPGTAGDETGLALQLSHGRFLLYWLSLTDGGSAASGLITPKVAGVTT